MVIVPPAAILCCVILQETEGGAPGEKAAGGVGRKQFRMNRLRNFSSRLHRRNGLKGRQMNFAIRVRDLSPPKCFTLTVGFKRFD